MSGSRVYLVDRKGTISSKGDFIENRSGFHLGFPLQSILLVVVVINLAYTYLSTAPPRTGWDLMQWELI